MLKLYNLQNLHSHLNLATRLVVRAQCAAFQHFAPQVYRLWSITCWRLLTETVSQLDWLTVVGWVVVAGPQHRGQGFRDPDLHPLDIRRGCSNFYLGRVPKLFFNFALNLASCKLGKLLRSLGENSMVK